MSREICIYQEFLTDAHRAAIRSAADQAGLIPHFFTLDQFEEARECLQHCEVLYAHSVKLLRAAPASLKWYCCSFAGVDPYCKDPSVFANPDCMLTNSNGYGVTIAEHVVMVTLMLLRRMPEYEAVVRDRKWTNQLPIRSIRDNEFTLLGTGNIGSNVAERLRGMGAILPSVKVLIMSLPGTAETVHILDRARIALLPRDAYVINVGRGTAIEQMPLIEALNEGRLAGAALDVMDPEPLPPDHPLWSAKNLILTPHVSGNMTLGYTCDVNVEMFCADLLRYGQGKLPQNLVDRTRGY